MTVSSGSILSDALLKACRQRAAGYDRDNKFCQEDFDELKAAGYLKLTLPKEFGGLGYDARPVRARDAPAGAVRAGDRALPQHAPLLGRHRRRQLARAATSRSSGSSRTRRRARCSPPGHAESGNETSLAAVDDEGRESRRRLQVHRPQVVRQPDAGVDAARPPRHGHERSDEPEDRPRLPAARHAGRHDQGHLGRAWACARRAATTPCSRARSSPTSTSRASCRPALPAPTTSSSASSRGRWAGSPTSTTASRSAMLRARSSNR